MGMGVPADLNKFSVFNAVHVKIFTAAGNESLAVGMRQNVNGAIIKKHSIHHVIFRSGEVYQ